MKVTFKTLIAASVAFSFSLAQGDTLINSWNENDDGDGPNVSISDSQRDALNSGCVSFGFFDNTASWSYDYSDSKWTIDIGGTVYKYDVTSLTAAQSTEISLQYNSNVDSLITFELPDGTNGRYGGGANVIDVASGQGVLLYLGNGSTIESSTEIALFSVWLVDGGSVTFADLPSSETWSYADISFYTEDQARDYGFDYYLKPILATGSLTSGINLVSLVSDPLFHGDPITWGGGNGTWNNNVTTNKVWTSDEAPLGDFFKDGNKVIFGGTSGTVTIEGTVAPDTITVNGGNHIFVRDAAGGEISGATTTLAVTDGTLTINLANTYGGGTTVSGGTLNATAANALGTGVLTISDSGTVNLSAANALGSGAITINGGVLNASIANALGANAVNLAGGILTASATGALGTSVVTFAGGVLQISSDMTLANVFAQTGDSTARISVDAGKTLTFAATRAGAITHTLEGAGTLLATVTGALGTGAVTVNSGTLKLAHTGVSTMGALTIGAGGTFEAAAGGTSIVRVATATSSGAISVTSGVFSISTLTVSGDQTWSVAAGSYFVAGAGNGVRGTFSGSTTETSTMTITGGGTVILGNASAAVTGYANLNWIVTSGSTLASIWHYNGATANQGSALGASVTLDNGTLQSNWVNATATAVGTVAGNTGNWMWNTKIYIADGGGTIYQDDVGTRVLVLSGGLYDAVGAINPSASTLKFTESNATGTLYTTYVFSNAVATNTSTFSGTIEVGAYCYIQVGGQNNNVTNEATMRNAGIHGTLHAGNLTLLDATSRLIFSKATAALTYDGIISGAGNVMLSNGTGGAVSSNTQVITLSGANTYTGGTTITNGTLRLTGNGALGTGAISIAVDGKLEVAKGGDIAFTQVISGAGSIIQSGVGSTTLSGINTYTGITTISAGKLILSGTGVLGTGAVTNNATLEIAKTTNSTLANIISGSGAVAHTGTGTTTLSGANTYTGGTAVSGGILNATTAGALGGTAVIKNALTVTGGTVNISVAQANLGATAISAGSVVLSGTGTLGTTGVVTISGTGTLNLGGLAVSNAITYNGGTLSNYSAYTGAMTLNADWGMSTATALNAAASVIVGGTAEFTLTGLAVADSTNLFTLASLTNSAGGELTFNLTNGQDTMTEGTYWLLSAYTGGTATGSLGWNESILDSAVFSWEWTPSAGTGGALGLVITAVIPPDVHGNPVTWSGTGTTWNNDTANKAWTSTDSPSGDYFENTNDVIFADTGSYEFVEIEGTVTPGTIKVTGGTYTFVDGGSGVIADNGVVATTLTKSGAGTLTILTTNTATGAMSITAGKVELGNTTTAGTWAGNITLSGTGTLSIVTAQTTPTSTLTIGAGTTAALDGTTGDWVGTITMTGGTLEINRAYSLSKVFTAGTGTIKANQDVTISGANTATGIALNIADTKTVALTGSWAGAIALNATGMIRLQAANTTLGAVTGSGTIIVQAANTTLSTVAGGLIQVDAAGVLNLAGTPSFGTANLALNGGRLHSTATGTVAAGINLVGASSIEVNASTTLTLSGVVSGANGLTKLGTGTLTLNGNNTFTGGVTVSAGTLNLGHLGAAGTGAISLAAGTSLGLNATGTYTNAITLAGSTTMTNATAVTLSGTMSGAGNLTKAGVGVLTLSATNTYTGTTTVSAGKLVAGSASALGTGAVAISDGTLDLGNKSVANAISTTAGAGTRTITNAGEYTNKLTVGANTTLVGALGVNTAVTTANMEIVSGATLTWTGTASTSGSLFTLKDFANSGNVYFSLTNGGPLAIGEYTLLTATGTHAAWDIGVGRTTYTWNNTLMGDGLSWAWTASGDNLILRIYQAGTENYTSGDSTPTEDKSYNNVNSGTLVVNSGITVTLTGDAIAGNVSVAGGALDITAPTGVNNVTAAISARGVAGGINGIVDVTGSGVNIQSGGSVSGGTITVTSGTMVGTLTDIHNGTKSESTLENFTGTAAIAVAGGTGTLDNVTVGSGGMTIAADGIAHVTGLLNATGSITGVAGSQILVSGTLISNGGISNAGIIVQDGGTLKGAGNFGNSITVQGGGTHVVGNSPGDVGTNNYTVNDDGTAIYYIKSRAEYSQTSVNGQFSLYDESIFRIELDGFVGLSALSFANPLVLDIVLFDTLKLDGFGYDLSISTDLATANTWLLNNTDIFVADHGLALIGAKFVATPGGGQDYALQLTYIPEPTTATLGILGLAGLLLRRRRKA